MIAMEYELGEIEIWKAPSSTTVELCHWSKFCSNKSTANNQLQFRF